MVDSDTLGDIVSLLGFITLTFSGIFLSVSTIGRALMTEVCDLFLLKIKPMIFTEKSVKSR